MATKKKQEKQQDSERRCLNCQHSELCTAHSALKEVFDAYGKFNGNYYGKQYGLCGLILASECDYYKGMGD